MLFVINPTVKLNVNFFSSSSSSPVTRVDPLLLQQSQSHATSQSNATPQQTTINPRPITAAHHKSSGVQFNSMNNSNSNNNNNQQWNNYGSAPPSVEQVNKLKLLSVVIIYVTLELWSSVLSEIKFDILCYLIPRIVSA